MPISPLPWIRDEYGHIVDATGEKIGLRGVSLSYGGPDATAQANTDLFFASPRLLSALNDILELIDMDPEANDPSTNLWLAIQVAKAVVDEAEGGAQ